MAAEEPSGVLNYVVYVLKVSIHCQGCEKKIRRILNKIDGVYKVDIDARQNKVTVMANVDGDVLVRKLAKSRKYAELLPPPEKKTPDGGVSDSKGETKAPSEPEQQQGNATEVTAATAAAPEQKTTDDAAAPADAAAEPAKTDEEAEKNVKEQAKSDDEMVEASNQPPEKAAEGEANAPAPGESAGSNGTAGGGSKKKGKKAKKNGGGEVTDATRSMDVTAEGPLLIPAPYIYPYPFYAPHPSYVVSYNVAQPSVSQDYHLPAVPPASQSFVYHPYPPQAEFYYGTAANGGAPLPHLQSYSMFSDENPNACNLM